jgi:2-polyprenyl-3-methyl-5-hydroxy-6-metoxy-1,4-benzoquinol methylase
MTNCPICKKDKFSILTEDTLGDSLPYFGYDFNTTSRLTNRILLCSNCGHGFSNPIPPNIYSNYIDIEDIQYLKNKQSRILIAHKILNIIKKYTKGGKLLDVGCSTGDFLSIAKSTFDAEGLELSEWASKEASKHNLVHKMILSDLYEKKYDLITLWGVIEHFENPEKEIKEIYRLLNSNGILCIWTGDRSSITAKILGLRWWYYMGQHIQYFTKNSLDLLLTQNNFIKKATYTYPYVMSLRQIANSLKRYKALGSIAGFLFNNKLFGNITITIKLPGEMFRIYQKK